MILNSDFDGSIEIVYDPCLLCVPPIVKRVLIHSLIDLLCMLLQHCGMSLI